MAATTKTPFLPKKTYNRNYFIPYKYNFFIIFVIKDSLLRFLTPKKILKSAKYTWLYDFLKKPPHTIRGKSTPEYHEIFSWAYTCCIVRNVHPRRQGHAIRSLLRMRVPGITLHGSGVSGSCIIPFRLDAALGRSKTLFLRLGETASIISKPCVIKRYAPLNSSDHLLCAEPQYFSITDSMHHLWL